MPTPTTAHRLELAHRESNGIEITLFWSEPAQGLTVEIFDVRLEERLTFAVDAADALDAFYHPYAYAA